MGLDEHNFYVDPNGEPDPEPAKDADAPEAVATVDPTAFNVQELQARVGEVAALWATINYGHRVDTSAARAQRYLRIYHLVMDGLLQYEDPT